MKKNQAKKKITRRMKRQVRKTLGVILLITAITVAAIPVSPVQADSPIQNDGGERIDPIEPYAYPATTVIDAAKTANSTGNKPTKKSTPSTSYTVRTNDDGTREKVKQFDYDMYDAVKNHETVTAAIITKYYDLKDAEINIQYQAISKYLEISSTDFSTELTNIKKAKGFVDNSGNAIDSIAITCEQIYLSNYGTTTDKARTDVINAAKAYEFLQKYAGVDAASGEVLDTSLQTKMNDFDQAYATYLQTKNNNGDVSTLNKTQSFNFNDLSEKLKMRAYCDFVQSVTVAGDILDLRSCTLVAVKDGQNITYMIYPYSTASLSEKLKMHYDSNTGLIYENSVDVLAIDDEAFSNLQSVDSKVRKVTLSNYIIYIGDKAFENCTKIEEITLGSSVSYIGNQAFKGCSKLATVNFNENTTSLIIGVETFKDCGITSLTFPNNLVKICVGAFADCINLETVDFSKIQMAGYCQVDEAAFYNDYNLQSVQFFAEPETQTKCAHVNKLGMACFGLADNYMEMNQMTDFIFPDFITGRDSSGNAYVYNEADGTIINSVNKPSSYDNPDLGNYMFVNRANLAHVTMPKSFGTTGNTVEIPDGFFLHCEKLRRLIIPFNTKGNIKYTTVTSKATGAAKYRYALFDSVIDNNINDTSVEHLAVMGPMSTGTLDVEKGEEEPTMIRRTTWKAMCQGNSVPYMYEKDGQYVYEVSVNVDDTTDTGVAFVLSISSDGELINATVDLNGQTMEPSAIRIPTTVNGIHVRSIKEGCFSKYVKGFIKKVSIEDDSLTTIGAEIFSECPELTEVYIGNSVRQIGEKAFYDCPKLENVFFRTPGEDYTVMEDIPTSAFETKGNRLIFHGDINENYAPFKYAMDDNVWVKDDYTARIPICYKSDYVANDNPGFLTVIKEIYCPDENRKDQTAYRTTLVDYLHYEELVGLPSDFITKYVRNQEEVTDWKELMYNYEHRENKADENFTLANNYEMAVINATQFIVIPAGIDSIDVKTYLNSGLNDKAIVTYLHNTQYPADEAYATNVEHIALQKYAVNLADSNIMELVGATNAVKFEEGATITIKSNIDAQNVNKYDVDRNKYKMRFSAWQIKAGDQDLEDGRYIDGTTKTSTTVKIKMPASDLSIGMVTIPTREEKVNASGSVIVPKNITLSDGNGTPVAYEFEKWEISCNSSVTTSAITTYNAKVTTANTSPTPVSQGGIDVYEIPLMDTNDPNDYAKNKDDVTVIAVYKPVANVQSRRDLFTNDTAGAALATGTESNNYYQNYLKYGLFNGYYGFEQSSDTDFAYSVREFASDGVNNALEKEDIGNDTVKSIKMSTVSFLPDKAFNSCENLTYVDLGSEMKDIGEEPFANCSNLRQVEASGNREFWTSPNGILYRVLGENQYELVKWLVQPTNGTTQFPMEGEPDASSIVKIDAGACENIDNLISVDLTNATNLVDIPRNCFKNCPKLSSVKLPTSVRSIGSGAFWFDTDENGDSTSHSLVANIPSNNVIIEDKAFSAYALLRSNKGSTAEKYANLHEGVDFEDIGSGTCYITFVGYDGKVILVVPVSVNENATDKAPEPPVWIGHTFTGWSADISCVKEDLIVIAQYVSDGSEIDPSTLDYYLMVEGGSGDGKHKAGETVIITADDPDSGYKFDTWKSLQGDVQFDDAKKYLTTIVMPATDAAVKATYVKSSSGSGSSGNGSTSSGNSNNSNNSNGSSSSSSNSSSSNSSSSNNSSGGTSSGNSSSGNSSSSNSSSSNTNKNNGSSSGSGSSSSNKGSSSSSGTQVQITKPGISNTGLSSATVNGSSDNFIVKITEDNAATDAVRQALINEYGSLEDLAYLAMDISLYDSTGTTKITNTQGISVTITMPIPDALIQYAGNNKAAGVVDSANGYALDKLNAKFSTIDGIPCITFTATHFSPYTIYVKTTQLSQGTVLDSTPKTGDGIHPKWFLSIGLAALSVFLFFKKDRKQTLPRTVRG